MRPSVSISAVLVYSISQQPARRPSGSGCSCIRGKVVDEVGVLVVGRWDGLVGVWPGALPRGALPGWSGAVGAGIVTKGGLTY